MKISFITTVFNEEKTIEGLLESLKSQTKKPDEVIIVDGTSTDKTVERIKNFEPRFKKESKFELIQKKGNRSVGRNEAIRNARGDLIVCTDAGCILQKDWIEQIAKPFKDSKVDVVAGYYEGLPKNIFEKCLIPYVLVMKDKVNLENFLPATRSMAFKKSFWEKAGKFDERLSNNEDYSFARKLKKVNAKIVFAKDAIVYWIPRENIKESFIMFYRFALGDGESGLFRPKVAFVFLRYISGLILVSLYLFSGNTSLLLLVSLFLLSYIFWAILKNFKYIKHPYAYFYLPLLQFVSDFAVLLGTSIGIVNRLGKRN